MSSSAKLHSANSTRSGRLRIFGSFRALREAKIRKVLLSYFGVSLAIAAGAAFFFAWLSEEVLEKEFTQASTNILLWIHSFASPIMTEVAMFFTDLGSMIGIGVLSFALLLYLIRIKDRPLLYAFVGLMLGSLALVVLLKSAFQQIRPDVFTPLVIERTFSFPSGHSLMSFSFWGFIAWWIVDHNPKRLWRWCAAIVCVAIAVCVALSRLYLGVHWPTDVLAGMLLSMFWLSACVTAHEWVRRKERAAHIPGQGDTPVTPKP